VLFEKAWDAHTDDFEACVAAHYVARHQPDQKATFRWNEESLRRADAVGDERVRGFYPSLHLNMGRSYESLGDLEKARRHYEVAAEGLDDVPPGPYGDVVRHGIAEALRRTSVPPS
jgi:tetratricopeptide (TPR) repeat protein